MKNFEECLFGGNVVQENLAKLRRECGDREKERESVPEFREPALKHCGAI